MATVLDKILATKREELAALKRRVSLADVRAKAGDAEEVRDFAKVFASQKPRVKIITEMKRTSPSAGVMVRDLDPVRLAHAYEEAGAVALSVLTDQHFFGGSLKDLEQARTAVALPVLRKDFLLDPYQVYETRAASADQILLIAGMLETNQLKDLSALALELGMGSLVEIHREEELQKLGRLASHWLIGINHRDLKTLAMDLDVSARLRPLIPKNHRVIAESGITKAADIAHLLAIGVDGFLIGEVLMKSTSIATKMQEFLETSP